MLFQPLKPLFGMDVVVHECVEVVILPNVIPRDVSDVCRSTRWPTEEHRAYVPSIGVCSRRFVPAGEDIRVSCTNYAVIWNGQLISICLNTDSVFMLRIGHDNEWPREASWNTKVNRPVKALVASGGCGQCQSDRK